VCVRIHYLSDVTLTWPLRSSFSTVGTPWSRPMAISDLVCIKEPIKNSLSEQSFTPQHQIPPCSTQSDQQQFSGFAFSSFYQKYPRQNNEHYNYYCIYNKHNFYDQRSKCLCPKRVYKVKLQEQYKTISLLLF